MISTTLKQYLNTHQEKLDAYLNEYEDNIQQGFFYEEHKLYSGYFSALVSVSKEIKGYNLPNIVSIREDILSNLNFFYKEVYNDIITYDCKAEDLQEITVKDGFILVNQKKLENYIKSVTLILKFISSETSPVKARNDFNLIVNDRLKAQSIIDINKYKDFVWFKVGVLFASGEMEKYYNLSDKKELTFKENFTAPKVARELGDEKYVKEILASIKNYDLKNSNQSKNIFNSPLKMKVIIEHCQKNKIVVIPYFIHRLTSR